MLAAQVTRRGWGPGKFAGIDVPAASHTVDMGGVSRCSVTASCRLAFPSGQAFLALHAARCSPTLVSCLHDSLREFARALVLTALPHCPLADCSPNGFFLSMGSSAWGGRGVRTR